MHFQEANAVTMEKRRLSSRRTILFSHTQSTDRDPLSKSERGVPGAATGHHRRGSSGSGSISRSNHGSCRRQRRRSSSMGDGRGARSHRKQEDQKKIRNDIPVTQDAKLFSHKILSALSQRKDTLSRSRHRASGGSDAAGYRRESRPRRRSSLSNVSTCHGMSSPTSSRRKRSEERPSSPSLSSDTEPLSRSERHVAGSQFGRRRPRRRSSLSNVSTCRGISSPTSSRRKRSEERPSSPSLSSDTDPLSRSEHHVAGSPFGCRRGVGNRNPAKASKDTLSRSSHSSRRRPSRADSSMANYESDEDFCSLVPEGPHSPTSTPSLRPSSDKILEKAGWSVTRRAGPSELESRQQAQLHLDEVVSNSKCANNAVVNMKRELTELRAQVQAHEKSEMKLFEEVCSLRDSLAAKEGEIVDNNSPSASKKGIINMLTSPISWGKGHRAAAERLG